MILNWPTSWIPYLHMTQSDKAILESSNVWLSDSIINAAQLLLKRGNAPAGGLQKCELWAHRFL